jgi:hypothetical protein
MRGHERDDPEQSGAGGRTRQIRERERPEPSNVWQTSAFAFLTCAAGTIVAALTVSEHAAIQAPGLWIITAGLLLAAALCFAAHWDVNRGRRISSARSKNCRPDHRREKALSLAEALSFSPFEYTLILCQQAEANG